MKSIVIALGGNALLNPSGKQSFVKENHNMDRVAASIARLSNTWRFSILVTHGNGSQVGDEIMRNEHAKKYVPKLPLYALNAETQAVIGSVIATSLRNKGIKQEVSVVLAHVLVNRGDPAFKHPTKQVGPFYSGQELQAELKLEKFAYINSHSKYRQVVASPRPVQIVEFETIRKLAKTDVVITCGGGGIPVIRGREGLEGIDAVIDKDLTSQLLANSVGADTLVILTNSKFVYRDYAKKRGPIKSIRASVLKKTLSGFEEGTMRPKIDACVRFIENGGKEAYIGNVFELEKILAGKSGTKIT